MITFIPINKSRNSINVIYFWFIFDYLIQTDQALSDQNTWMLDNFIQANIISNKHQYCCHAVPY